MPTLTGEVRLWYESLRTVVIDWQGLQDNFRQQYSKIGNTCEKLFHAWRSFHYDEKTETLDGYVTRIRQVAALLGYGEPQILEVFKYTLPNILLSLFPIEDLRQGVETAKRILTKEKIDRQLSGHSTRAAPFMKVSDVHKSSSNKKAVSFNSSETNDKIDKLTSLVSKMKVKMDKLDTQFKPQIYQSKRRAQNRCNYTQNDYWTRNRSLSRERDTSYRGKEILVKL